jgi:hypothetical protein
MRAVDDNEPDRPQVGRVLHGCATFPGQVEVTTQGIATIVIAGQGVQRCSDARESLAYQPILGVGSVIGQVARQEDRLRSWSELVHRLGDGVEPDDRIAAAPIGTDVRIADLDEQKRLGYGHRPAA